MQTFLPYPDFRGVPDDLPYVWPSSDRPRRG